MPLFTLISITIYYPNCRFPPLCEQWIRILLTRIEFILYSYLHTQLYKNHDYVKKDPYLPKVRICLKSKRINTYSIWIMARGKADSACYSDASLILPGVKNLPYPRRIYKMQNLVNPLPTVQTVGRS